MEIDQTILVHNMIQELPLNSKMWILGYMAARCPEAAVDGIAAMQLDPSLNNPWEF